jgi:mono/diheme cytochrome c family protein
LKAGRLAAIGSGAAVVALIASCSSLNTPPPPAISPALIQTGAREHATPGQLADGRALFVSRCTECHVLPEIEKHSPMQWREIIGTMAGRAELKPEQREAVLAYLLAARQTPQ